MTMFSAYAFNLVEGLIEDARSGIVSLPTFRRRTEPQEIWFELAFCIVSSQERTRNAKFAAEVLAEKYDDLLKCSDTLAAVKSAFSERYISLRFQNRKSEHLASSWKKFQMDCQVLVDIDTAFETASEARRYLTQNFLGIGPKQASMLLRNVGWGEDLAIIDSHISRISWLILPDRSPTETYDSLESKLRTFARERSIKLEELDVILWSCARILQRDRVREPALV